MLETSLEIAHNLKDGIPGISLKGLAFSGGDDSLLTLKIAQELGIKIDFLIHAKTGTGIPKTFSYVEDLANKENLDLIVADAGNSYESYVLRKGFFGLGSKAHSFAYHVLKERHISKSLAQLRKNRRNYSIILFNGVRLDESKRRSGLYSERPITRKGSTYWVNLIQHWSKQDRDDYLWLNQCDRNPVSVQLCKSGEYWCGTMQSLQERAEASTLYPEWGKWLDDLEQEVIKRFPWGWGEASTKDLVNKAKGNTLACEC